MIDKIKMKSRLIMVVLVACLLVVTCTAVFAGCYKCTTNITNNYTTIIEEDYFIEDHDSELAGAASLAIAHSGLHFGTNTRKWQMGVSGGTYDGEESLVFGLAKFDGDYLWTGSVGRTHGHNSGNVGFHWTID
jgi:hypothetical protein